MNLHGMLPAWDKTPTEGAGRTLVIEPRITEIKFINTAARIWTGAMSGRSAVILTAAITDKETSKVIARPIFYSRAKAIGAAFTLGAADNLMLTRIAKRFTDYLEANYSHAVGGPSGVGI